MPSNELTLQSAVSAFGVAAKAKLAAVAARGAPEDQLRAPIETLFKDMAELCNRQRAKLDLVGESSLAELQTRPDYAVAYADVLTGFVEIKAPGKGADPRRFRNKHDKAQWQKLSALPNLIYTDGNQFSLWRGGELAMEIVRLDGDIESSGADLDTPIGLLHLFEAFFSWQPIAPTSPPALADMTARMCRLLRHEVAEQVTLGDSTLNGLWDDWRHLLFPNASPDEFADSYAQAVTFGLLLARAQGISLDNGVDTAARRLSEGTHSLIGAALRVLTDSIVRNNVLATSIATLSRVLAVVDWPTISRGDPDAWLYFYEHFLAEYDNELRKQTGSYYTPVEVVRAMTVLVEEALAERLDIDYGLADPDVTILDPAAGTGTFLLSVIRSIAATIDADQGAGAVSEVVSDALRRLIGFEMQIGPFAVAQLRVLAELAELEVTSVEPNSLHMYVTDTLDNPYVEEQSLGTWYEPIAQARRDANEFKRQTPVTVVIGNPPYKEKSKGKGGWVESGNPAAVDPAPLAAFIPPKEWGVGAHVKHLYNPYVYFWRWATWKVFDSHHGDDHGVVCMITVAGFLDGPGFERMRDYLRRRADAIWVIDCSPDGHMPPQAQRVFQGVKQPVCIMLAVRDGSTDSDTPAPVHFQRLPEGRREDKFEALGRITLRSDAWQRCPDGRRAPFLPADDTAWATYPSLDDLLRWSGSGVMPGRTWVIAPDKETLRDRWDALINSDDAAKPQLMSEHPTDRRVDTELSSALPGFPVIRRSIAAETEPCLDPVRIGYRTLDQQWIIPDKRVINRPNPTLWSVRSDSQVFLTAPHDLSPTAGPVATMTAEIPDLHHYHGRGGRSYPLWLDAAGTMPNVVPGLLPYLRERYGREVTGPDLFAYLAGVLAHPAFVTTFAISLQTPGIRVPLTTDPALFDRAAALGRRVLWLHSYGERFADPAADRPRGAPRMPAGSRPTVLAGHSIPSDPEHMPDELKHDPVTNELHVGDGRIGNVTAAMFGYEVSGMNVLSKWFSYRRKSRERPIMGDRRVSPLLTIQSDRWKAEYTTDLINLLNVIGLLVELEPAQADVLSEIVAAPVITTDDLTAAGVLPVAVAARKVTSTVLAPEEGTLDFPD